VLGCEESPSCLLVFAEDLFAILSGIGLDPAFLVLVVTESLLMKRQDFTAANLHTLLREKGVQAAIDDFGTAYSSLSYLTKLPLDTLKIDQSFIRRITTTPDEASIVTAIVGIGQDLRQQERRRFFICTICRSIRCRRHNVRRRSQISAEANGTRE
jgi:EAL domain-containing protein (putative c-di-GMP-specific phosphodiesterase class I)